MMDISAVISGIGGLANTGVGLTQFLQSIMRQRQMRQDPRFSYLMNSLMDNQPIWNQGTGAWRECRPGCNARCVRA